MKSRSGQFSEPHDALQAIVARLDPLMKRHGFRFRVQYNASSSGGPFENGFYRRYLVRIGLIVRGSELGNPIYEWAHCHTGHNELIKRLGRVNDSVLRCEDAPDKWELVNTDSRDIVDGLIADLENIILPAIIQTPGLYRRAVIDAHSAQLERWGLRPTLTKRLLDKLKTL